MCTRKDSPPEQTDDLKTDDLKTDDPNAYLQVSWDRFDGLVQERRNSSAPFLN